jgi:type 1 glutamine amidotransferase
MRPAPSLRRLVQRWLTRALLTVGSVFAAGVLLATPFAAADDEAGFQPIFNGTNLDGWDGNPKIWSVKDGAIVGETTAENMPKEDTFCVWQLGTVDDFVLRLQIKISGKTANSGVQYRSHEFEKWRVGGYQADWDLQGAYIGTLYEQPDPTRPTRGQLARGGTKVVLDADGKNKEVTKIADPNEFIEENFDPEGWNEYEITAQGNHLTHKLNGKLFMECIDNDAAKRAMSGILAVQVHGGRLMKVEFKNIRLKRLKLSDARKKMVLVSGVPSHGPGDHEFNAGTRILKDCLDNVPEVVAAIYRNGWPADPTAFDNADMVMLYMDGGSGHPAIQQDHLQKLGALMDKGVGLACLHYAVEIPKDKGGPEFLKWIGGYYETGFSTNPHWDADFEQLPKHPTTRGVEPFVIRDEWYYNIRFPEGGGAVQPLLVAVPPDGSRGTAAAKEHPGRTEVVAWAIERPDGGRGFGFTGGHTHKNWGNDNFRRFVLNSLLWTAGVDVPSTGVASTVTDDELAENLDPKK